MQQPLVCGWRDWRLAGIRCGPQSVFSNGWGTRIKVYLETVGRGVKAHDCTFATH